MCGLMQRTPGAEPKGTQHKKTETTTVPIVQMAKETSEFRKVVMTG